MSIYDSMRASLLEARRSKESDKLTILSTLIGEMETKAKGGKTPTGIVSDDLAIEVLQNSYKATLENIKHYALKSDTEASRVKYFSLVSESEILEDIIPKERLPLSNSAMEEIIKDYLLTTVPVPNKGGIMKWLGQNYKGRYDGKAVAQIVERLLA